LRRISVIRYLGYYECTRAISWIEDVCAGWLIEVNGFGRHCGSLALGLGDVGRVLEVETRGA